MKNTKEEREQDQRDIHNFNEGRLSCDRKWLDNINDRIEELEKLVGIPELKKLRNDCKYKWKNDELDEEKTQ